MIRTHVVQPGLLCSYYNPLPDHNTLALSSLRYSDTTRSDKIQYVGSISEHPTFIFKHANPRSGATAEEGDQLRSRYSDSMLRTVLVEIDRVPRHSMHYLNNGVSGVNKHQLLGDHCTNKGQRFEGPPLAEYIAISWCTPLKFQMTSSLCIE